MEKIEINIFNVNLPDWGGVFRNIYLMNSPIKDYSFHLFEGLEKEPDKFLANLKKILAYEVFKDSEDIEVSFDKDMKMPVGEADQKKFQNLTAKQHEEILVLLQREFPNYYIIDKSV